MSGTKKRKSIVVTSESVADLSPELIEKYGIAIIPHKVRTEEGLFKDGKEIETQGVLKYMEEFGNDYSSLLKLADKALYNVKKNGKHGYGLYDDDIEDSSVTALNDIRAISEILGERSIQDVALQLDKDSFSPVYRYVIRYIIRHRINACKILFTLEPASGIRNSAFFERVDEFGNHIRESLRKSDIFMRNSKNQYFVFLTDIRTDSIAKVISHILDEWHSKGNDDIVITYETESIGNQQESAGAKKVKKVVVVDDDVINLQVAGKILSSGGLRVAALRSGEALFGAKETIRKCRPAMKIACYHRSEDVFAIVKKVMEIRDDYKIYMRHTRCIPGWDTDFYFI